MAPGVHRCCAKASAITSPQSSQVTGHGLRTRPLPMRSPLKGSAVGMQGTQLTQYQTAII